MLTSSRRLKPHPYLSLLFLVLVAIVTCNCGDARSSSSSTSIHGGSSSTASTSSGGSSSAASSTTTTTLPRSQLLSRHSNTYDSLPPWNPSSKIDAYGFLQGQYMRTPGEWEEEVRLKTRHTLQQPCRIRQVPGDGNCLFHSLSLCLCYAVNGTHWNLLPSAASSPTASSWSTLSHANGQDNDEADVPPPPTLDDLYVHSRSLRAQAVACLRDTRRRLVLQGRESLPATALVEAAAQQYGLSADDYCASMQEESVWGGGPEIVALCNLLQRPIHVYELATASMSSPTLPSTTEEGASSTPSEAGNAHSGHQSRLFPSLMGGSSNVFVLRRMACFGSPRFDRREALHILSADSRFPDLRPGQQLAAGNHFLAVFPIEDDNGDGVHSRSNARRRRKRIRGGGDSSKVSSASGTSDAQPWFWQRLASQYMDWWRDTM